MDFHIPFNLYQQKYRYKYLALYHALRDAIVSGTLPHGSRLPATRELSELYLVSRGVASQVYDMLVAEGYLSSEVGRGTYVSFNHERHPSAEPDTPPVPLSDWGQRIAAIPKRHRRKDESHIRFDFTVGRNDQSAFPYTEWNRTLYSVVRDLSAQQRDEAFAAEGHRPLREAIALYLRRARGIEAEADDIVIVNGSMQAIALLAQLLVNPGDSVVHEDPGYRGIRQAVDAVGGTLCPAPVDEHGLIIEDWPARLLFVTPSRQFPTGAVLSLERRQELLQWANRHNALIVEDDYDSEFRHQGRPIEPLKALDNGSRVVYIGTFSKTLFSDIRLGYVVLPPWLREPFAKARYLFEPHPTALLQQHAVAHFMNSGHYERHLRRMKRIYAKKHKICSRVMQEQIGDWFSFVDSDAGLHLFGWWQGTPEQYQAFRQACYAQGIILYDAAPYTMQEPRIGVLFGFSHLSEAEIRTAVREMAVILASLTR